MISLYDTVWLLCIRLGSKLLGAISTLPHCVSGAFSRLNQVWPWEPLPPAMWPRGDTRRVSEAAPNASFSLTRGGETPRKCSDTQASSVSGDWKDLSSPSTHTARLTTSPDMQVEVWAGRQQRQNLGREIPINQKLTLSIATCITDETPFIFQPWQWIQIPALHLASLSLHSYSWKETHL